MPMVCIYVYVRTRVPLKIYIRRGLRCCCLLQRQYQSLDEWNGNSAVPLFCCIYVLLKYHSTGIGTKIISFCIFLYLTSYLCHTLERSLTYWITVIFSQKRPKMIRKSSFLLHMSEKSIIFAANFDAKEVLL